MMESGKIEPPKANDELELVVASPNTAMKSAALDFFGPAAPVSEEKRLLLQARPLTYKRADSGLVFGIGSVVFLWLVASYWVWMGLNGLSLMEPLWATLWIVATCIVVLAAVKQTAISTVHFLVHKNWNTRNYSAIEMLCSRSLSIVSRLPFSSPWDLAYLEACLAGARMRQGFCQSAEELLKDSIDRTKFECEKASVANKVNFKSWGLPFLGSLLINRSVVSVKLEKYDEAERLCLEILELFKDEKRQEYRIYKVVPMMTQAWICLRWNEIEKAEDHINEAAAEFEKVMLEAAGTNEQMEQTQSAILVGMALIRARSGRLEDSLKCFESFKNFTKVTKSDICTHNIEWLSGLSEAYVEAGKFSEAEEAIELAYAAARELGVHPDAAMALNAFEKLLKATERASEIGDMRLWLRPSHEHLLAG